MKWLYSLLCPFFLLAAEPFSSPEEIKAESLLQSGPYDYVPIFQTLFAKAKVRTFLELGMGYQTKYFLQNARRVISIEFVTPGYGPMWAQKMMAFYQEESQWVPIIYFSGYEGDTKWAPFKYVGSEHVYKACSYQCSTHKNYALNDPFYISELDMFISNLTKYNQVDVAFVNPPMYLRSDLVEVLFGKVPVIIAHCTSVRLSPTAEDPYGYRRLHIPEEYEEIVCARGSGTTVWVQKNSSFSQYVEIIKQVAKL